jgi:hypothetical protein
MVSQDFKNNVASGDVIAVRSALVDYLIIDRTFQTFDECLQYAASIMPVMEEYDNRPFEDDPKNWDMSYLNSQKAALRYNFCEVRVNHIKSVIPVAMPLPEKHEATSNTIRPSKSNNSRTGRIVVSETERPNVSSHGAHHKAKSSSGSSGHPSHRVVTEIEHTVTVDEKTAAKPSKGGSSTALIVGGAAISVAAILMEKPIAIGAGIVVAGIGCAIKLTEKK